MSFTPIAKWILTHLHMWRSVSVSVCVYAWSCVPSWNERTLSDTHPPLTFNHRMVFVFHIFLYSFSFGCFAYNDVYLCNNLWFATMQHSLFCISFMVSSVSSFVSPVRLLNKMNKYDGGNWEIVTQTWFLTIFCKKIFVNWFGVWKLHIVCRSFHRILNDKNKLLNCLGAIVKKMFHFLFFFFLLCFQFTSTKLTRFGIFSGAGVGSKNPTFDVAIFCAVWCF